MLDKLIDDLQPRDVSDLRHFHSRCGRVSRQRGEECVHRLLQISVGAGFDGRIFYGGPPEVTVDRPIVSGVVMKASIPELFQWW